MEAASLKESLRSTIKSFGLGPKSFGAFVSGYDNNLIHDFLANAAPAFGFFYVKLIDIDSKTALFHAVVTGEDDVAHSLFSSLNKIGSG